MNIRLVDLPGSPQATAARALLDRARRADGIDALSEQFVLGLSDSRLGHRHALAFEGEEVVGLLAQDSEAELVVDPAHRRRGIATRLLAALPPTPVWAHGDLPAARGFAQARTMNPTRRLLVLGIEADALTRAARTPEPPEGYELSTLTELSRQWGRDRVLEQWLRVNNEAFDWHPEQGGWDRERLERAMEAAWFDPEGVVLLTSGRELAGFHWTKWHEEDAGLGEVYVVGLAAAHRGRRLGDPLLRAGLAHLTRAGARRVILYVEADNRAALKAYDRLGFAVAEQHVVYAPSGD
ncbi:mycothiol synthase [Corynebacterium sp. zg-331]|uniref:mycothiol synthase n=1 Tax=unclassified Corynebacterium TaxID=2624378 RepID=UPI00128C5243|nr:MULTISPECIES: mycothiol synthase [unclassified Corynebacterium]MBC3186955.1 mycothiol synthase [Corynebacterium sp. zg-331]MPV53433.1 mycothiol synthase [Corynebacterium sp. zg331]